MKGASVNGGVCVCVCVCVCHKVRDPDVGYITASSFAEAGVCVCVCVSRTVSLRKRESAESPEFLILSKAVLLIFHTFNLPYLQPPQQRPRLHLAHCGRLRTAERLCAR